MLIKNKNLSAVENQMKIQNIELLSTIITSDYGDLIIVVLYKDHMGDNRSLKAELIDIMHNVFQSIEGKPGMCMQFSKTS